MTTTPESESFPHMRRGNAAESEERTAAQELAASLRRLAVSLQDRDLPLDLARDAVTRIDAIESAVSRTAMRDYESAKYVGTSFEDFSPIAGWANPVAPPLDMMLHADGTVTGSVVFQQPFEGPPGHVHGGVLSAAFDEVLGLAQISGGRPGMTGRLVIHYRRPTPLNVEVRFAARVESVSGRKIMVTGESRVLVGDEWLVSAESEALFISLPNGFGQLAGNAS